jgi:acetoin utilization deacetylase AcuC-like enzyme
MRVFYSEDHRLHFPQAELSGGQFVTPFERPSRIEYILNRLKERRFSDVVTPGVVDMGPVAGLLDPGYLTFLETAWDEWKAVECPHRVVQFEC